MANHRHRDRDPKTSDPSSNDFRSSGSSNKIPTPLDFDRFIPWFMLEMQSNVCVSVKRVQREQAQHGHHGHHGHQEEHVRGEPIKRYSSKLKQVKFSGGNSVINDSSSKSLFNKVLEAEPYANALRITAFYDHQGHLTEIAFVDHPVPIHRQVLKAIALCLPFHKMLTKLSVRRTQLDCAIIYELSKLLPFSNLTDICLDHCHVLQENFYILLDQHTMLKHLSLSDCNIGDHACKKIAERLEDILPASKNLRVLNLSWNNITDVGAEALGRCLRTNRQLLHLNLCNNSITWVGAAHILLPLSEFPLFPDEIMTYKRRRFQYTAKKLEDADRCLKEIKFDGDADESDSHQQHHKDVKHSKSVHHRKKPRSREGSMELKGISDLEVGNESVTFFQCNDAFHPSNMILRDGTWFSIGNLVLCSLNLAYNKLDYSSVEKLAEVLSYQHHRKKVNMRTGLLRVVIEGNDLPESCDEYDLIDMYLKRSVKDMTRLSSPLKRRATSLMQYKERRKTTETKVKSTGM